MKKIIFGINTVNTTIECHSNKIDCIFILDDYTKNNRLNIIFNKIIKKKINFKLINKQYLNKKTQNSSHQGIAAKINFSSYKEDTLKKIIKENKNKFFLILDSITDTHNLGACLRSANAAGIQAVIIPKNRSAKLNATVSKIACGAAESLTIITVTNLSRTLNFLKLNNIYVLGTSQNAKSFLFTSKINFCSIAVVVGSEDKGIRFLTSKYCDNVIKIPMFGNISSLNVSVATGIILFEILRQRINNNIY